MLGSRTSSSTASFPNAPTSSDVKVTVNGKPVAEAFGREAQFGQSEEGQKHSALWLRGGFPDSFLAPDDRGSLDWRRDLIRTYLERDVPLFGSRVPAETLRRFWTTDAVPSKSLSASSSISNPPSL